MAVRRLRRMVSSANGFSIKSAAPAFIARTARGTSPCPVMTITGTSTRFSASFSWNCRPSMPGMRTSVTTQAGFCSRQRDKASSAEANDSTAKPADSKSIVSESRTASSSSTTYTAFSFGGFGIDIVGQRQREGEGDTPAGVWRGLETTAVGVDDRAADRQAETHALFLGRDERLEQLLLN